MSFEYALCPTTSQTCSYFANRSRPAGTKGGGAARPHPLPFTICYPLLPDESAGQEAAGHQQRAGVQREQRRRAGIAGLWQLLRGRRGGRGVVLRQRHGDHQHRCQHYQPP